MGAALLPVLPSASPREADATPAFRVSSPQDNAEREAVQVARRVMGMTEIEATPVASMSSRRPAQPAQPADRTKPAQPMQPVQRATGGVQRQAMAGGWPHPTTLPRDAAARIQAARSGGQALSPTLRAFMEPRFGADFSAVRLHAGAEAATLSRGLGARAFTAGAHIHFGAGQFQPETAAGRELIAHELAHTLQQGAARRVDASAVALPAHAALPAVQRSVVELAEHLYRMRDGRVIELPDDMTRAQAAQLEADAAQAQKKLGRRPPPQPVPEVRKPADKTPGKPAQAAARPPRRRGAGGPAGPRSAGVRAALKAVGGKVGQYLVARDAPVLARGIGALARLSRNEQTHDDAAKKLLQAEHAVVVPASEGQSRGNGAQVQAVGARPAPPVDPAVARAELQASLADKVPRSIEDVDSFKRDMKAQHVGADVLKVVQGDKNAVVQTFADMERTPPAVPPEQPAVPLPAPEVAPATAPLNLGAGAVAPLLPEHTDTRSYTNEADARLKEEGVTQEQLDMVDSGDLASANQEKKGLAAAAKSEPLAVQQLARQQTTQVAQTLQAEEKKERTALAGRRGAGLGAAALKQKGAKSALEKKRDEVAARINGIFKTAQGQVKARLAALETTAMKRFDVGNARASKAFEDDVARELQAYKDDRYSGWFGWARKAKDWLRGMDELPGVKAIFERNRTRFVRSIDQLVAEISAENQRVIQECKAQLAQARQDIQTYVDGLGPSLKDIGARTAGEVSSQLDEMDGYIRKKETELQQKLADKQQAAIKAIDEKIEKMKEAMAGALAKLGKLLLYAAKKFFTWALGKFGYSLADIERIINRGAAVLKAIFTQPINFVKNLMRAAILGFQNFGKNFLEHLQDAVFEWLTGSLQGLVLPKTWDAKGIVGLALQMIGISYQNLRRVMVEVMGEKPVLALEAGFALVKTLVTEGPMAAWEQLKEMAGEMRDAFVGAVKDFIKWKIVEEAIKWVVSLFIPGAGIVKAIIGIYDTVVFFIQKAKQIAQMVGNFLGSMGEIAAGNIAAAATAMENGLARGLSLVVSFLAALLRLNGITAKIREAIQKIRSKVDAALLKVVKWIAEKGKFILQKVAQGAVSGAKKAVAAIKDWWRARKEFRTADGHPHALYFQGERQRAQLIFASEPKPLAVYLKQKRATAGISGAVLQAITDAETLLKGLPAITRAKVETTDQAAVITGKLEQLARLLVIIDGQGAKPPAAFVFKPVSYGQLEVLRLAMVNAKGGSSPSVAPDWYQFLQGKGLTDNKAPDKWVRMHMLSEQVGGPGGNAGNLIPAPNSVNRGPRVASFERAVYQLVQKKPGTANTPTVIWMEVQGQGKHPVDPDVEGYAQPWFFKTVTMRAGLQFPENNDWRKETTARVLERAIPIPPPVFTFGPPTLRAPSATRLGRVDETLFTSSTVGYIKAAARGVNFTTFIGFERAVKQEVPTASWDRLWKPEVGAGIIEKIKKHVDDKRIEV